MLLKVLARFTDQRVSDGALASGLALTQVHLQNATPLRDVHLVHHCE